MRYRLTGIGAFGFNLNWEKKPGDREIASRVIVFLEARRLLFGSRHTEDELPCLKSAIQIRDFLTEQLMGVDLGESLSNSMRAMRSALRRFIDAAGPYGRNFSNPSGPAGLDPFSLALGDMRSLVGVQLDIIVRNYGLEIEEDLAQILPPQESGEDPSWVPGFGDFDDIDEA
jgi:hypothetical protein